MYKFLVSGKEEGCDHIWSVVRSWTETLLDGLDIFSLRWWCSIFSICSFFCATKLLTYLQPKIQVEDKKRVLGLGVSRRGRMCHSLAGLWLIDWSVFISHLFSCTLLVFMRSQQTFVVRCHWYSAISFSVSKWESDPCRCQMGRIRLPGGFSLPGVMSGPV